MYDLENESYDIKNELKIRKIIENKTPWYITVEKNPDKYDFDLIMYRYINDKKQLVCYIELENNKRWNNKYPTNYYSFLQRKIIDDHNNKHRYSDVYYMIYNNSITDCRCASVVDIINHGKFSARNGKNLKLSKRNDSYIELPIDSSVIICGFDNVLNHILKEK